MTPDPLYTDIRIPDFAVSWAGANPHGQSGFCFGSEDGRIVFTDRGGKPMHKPFAASPSGEAVNGIAAVNGCLAVSTRAELSTLYPPVAEGMVRGVAEHGAFAVIACDNYLVAPCGRDGFLISQPTNNPKSEYWQVVGPDDLGNVASVTSAVYLTSPKTPNVLAVSLRHNGVGLFDMRAVIAGQAWLRTATLMGLDFVDVCRIEIGKSLGFAALDRSGVLAFWRLRNHQSISNISRLKEAQIGSLPEPLAALRARPLTGVAYRLLSWRSHIIVLTSYAVYIFLDLARAIVEDRGQLPQTSHFFVSVMQGVDMNLCEDRYLLVVAADDSVRVFDLLALEAGHRGGTLDLIETVPKPEPFEPQWVDASYRSESRQLQRS